MTEGDRVQGAWKPLLLLALGWLVGLLPHFLLAEASASPTYSLPGLVSGLLESAFVLAAVALIALADFWLLRLLLSPPMSYILATIATIVQIAVGFPLWVLLGLYSYVRAGGVL